MKNKIRLTEGQLRSVIKESVYRILNEGWKTDYLKAAFNDGLDDEIANRYDDSYIKNGRHRGENEELYNHNKNSYDIFKNSDAKWLTPEIRHEEMKSCGRNAASYMPGLGGKMLRGTGVLASKLGKPFRK